MEPNSKPNETTSKEDRRLSGVEEVLGSLPQDFSDFRKQIDAEEDPSNREGHSVARVIAGMRGEEWTEGYNEHPEVSGTSVEEHENAARYNYGIVPLEFVVEQPEEYIIPECLPTCKDLWNKNISTVQCSNYNDKILYIQLSLLSDENETILKELTDHNIAGYYIKNDIHGERSVLIKAKTPEELHKLAQAFVVQDVQEGEGFMSIEDYLKKFRTAEGRDEFGNVTVLLDGQGDPNATLEQALAAKGDFKLYIPDEGRVYRSDFWLQKHNNYLKSKNQ